jgi:hypothetical protein
MTVITDDLPARLLHEAHEGWRAILAGKGGDYYQRTMTGDALLILPGKVLGRDQVRAAFKAAAPLDRYELHEPAVIRLGEHAGVLVYRSTAWHGDTATELQMSTTYLFDESNGGWCIAAHQESAV